MRKLILSVAVISAIVFVSCSNQSNSNVITTDSTSVDSLDSFEISLDTVSVILTDSIISDTNQ